MVFGFFLYNIACDKKKNSIFVLQNKMKKFYKV